MLKVIRIFIVTTILFTSYLAAAVLLSEENIERKSENTISALSVGSAFRDLKEGGYFEPISVSLDPSSDGNIKLEKLSLETDGKLQVPSVWENAGWYKRSAKAGQVGNVVIVGHYDTGKGIPAAFGGLKNLKVNDTVILHDELRRNFSYRVVDLFYVGIQDPQRTHVFEETDRAELTLMTCGGVWDPTAGTYDKRFVVRAELVSTDKSMTSSSSPAI